MKRIIASIMIAVFVAVSFSGCKLINSLTEYWDGMTKSETREYIEDTLKEKYNEEFTVLQTFIEGSSNYLLADCSPISNNNIVFEIQAFPVGNSKIMRDTYIQSIVRSEVLNIINLVLSKYSLKYAVDVDVQGLYNEYESGIREAENATIKNYSESLPDTNITDIWIALNDDKKILRNNLQFIVEEITAELYKTHALIHFYYVTDDIVQHCFDERQNSRPTDRLVFYRILYGHYPCDAFNYKGKDGILIQISSINEY